MLDKNELDISQPCLLGIDEAGRGPCLGPMVYAAAYCAIEDISKLNALGADDSKQLTEEQRDVLRAKIDDAPFLASESIVLHAQELSAKMLRPAKYNLNAISHDTALELVKRAIERGVDVQEVYVDTVGNADSYAEKFRDAFPQVKKVVVAKKADAIYRIVGAASIVAKTTRDSVVRGWMFPEESGVCAETPVFAKDYGSGYPSDPRTKTWLRDHVDPIFGYPSFVRFSWATARVILEREAVSVTWACDDEDLEDANVDGVKVNDGGSTRSLANQQRTISAFFTRKPAVMASSADAPGGGRVSKSRKKESQRESKYLRRLGFQACDGF